MCHEAEHMDKASLHLEQALEQMVLIHLLVLSEEPNCVWR